MHKIIANQSLIISQNESHSLFECPQGEKLASDRLIFLLKDECVEFAEFDEVLKIPEHRIVILNVPDDLKIKLMKRQKEMAWQPIMRSCNRGVAIDQIISTTAVDVETITASQLAAIFETYQKEVALLND